MSRRMVVPDVPIDWDALHKQKQALLLAIDETSIELDRERDSENPNPIILADFTQRLEHLEGILSLIDALQDDAGFKHGIWKFPTKKFTMRHEEVREMLVEVEAVDEEEAYQLMAEHVAENAPADWDVVSKRTVILEMRED